MDKDTQFVIKMLESHRVELSREIKGVEERLSSKIDVLWAFRLRILGGATVAAFVGSATVDIIFKLLKGA